MLDDSLTHRLYGDEVDNVVFFFLLFRKCYWFLQIAYTQFQNQMFHMNLQNAAFHLLAPLLICNHWY